MDQTIALIEIRQQHTKKWPIPVVETKILDRTTLEKLAEYSKDNPPIISEDSVVPSACYIFNLN